MSFSCLQGVENYFTDTPLTGTKYSKAKYSRRSCMITRISYSHDGSFIHIRKRAHSHSLPEINLYINFKAQNKQTKTDTNPIPDPNRYRRRCPDPIARIQKLYTFIGTPEKSVHRVSIRNDSPGLVGWGCAKSTV